MKEDKITIMGQVIDMKDIASMKLGGKELHINYLNGGAKEFTYTDIEVARKEFEENEEKWLRWLEGVDTEDDDNRGDKANV